MPKEPVLLVAAGGLARETLAAIRATDDLDPIGLLDDDPTLHGTAIDGVRVLGASADVADHPDAALVICAGSGVARSAIVERFIDLGVDADRYATVVHPSASLGTNCLVGSGSILLANVVLTCDVTVEQHVVVMPNATLTHDVVVRSFATLCAGVSLGGSVHVDSAAYLGMNSAVRQGAHVGANSTLGMGSVLVKDLPPDAVWMGVPARSSQDRAL